MDMFEKATKQKVRFDSPKGALSVEDVWDLRLTARSGFSLDMLAKQLNRDIKSQEEESFVVKQNAASEALTLKFNIVKHIIDVKMAERDEAAKAAEKATQRQKILEVLDKKRDQSLEGKTEEELLAMLQG